MLKFKKNLKKFTSIALTISMLMCSMFIISVNAADNAETENGSVFTIPVFSIQDDSVSSESAVVCCNIIVSSTYAGVCRSCGKDISERSWYCGRKSYSGHPTSCPRYNSTP